MSYGTNKFNRISKTKQCNQLKESPVVAPRTNLEPSQADMDVQNFGSACTFCLPNNKDFIDRIHDKVKKMKSLTLQTYGSFSDLASLRDYSEKLCNCTLTVPVPSLD